MKLINNCKKCCVDTLFLGPLRDKHCNMKLFKINASLDVLIYKMPMFLCSGITCRLRKLFKIQTLTDYFLYYISMVMKMLKQC